MTKHTPGPWVASDWGYIVADDPTGRHEDIYIAEVCREDDEGRIVPPIEQQANARLIAAAPDLLNMCERLLGFAHHYADASATLAAEGMLANAKTLIAQAKGGAA